MLPFRLMPGSWGLRGRSYQIAKAEYELSGEELEYKLIEIQYDISKLYEDGKTPSDADMPIDYQKHKLALDLLYHKIDQDNHDMELATLEEKPYVNVTSSGFDFNEGLDGFWMELNWNSLFIEFLEKNGYEGTENQIVDEWQTDIARSQVMEQELGPEDEDVETLTNVVDLGDGKKSYE